MPLGAIRIQFVVALLFTPCLLASLGAEEQRIGGVVGGVVGLCVHAGGLVWWLKNLPVGFASTHEQRKPGRAQGHGRKPQLEAQQSEVQRPGEDVGEAFTLGA